MFYVSLAAALAFFICFIWYLASDDEKKRRQLGLAATAAALVSCLCWLFPLDRAIKLGLDLKGGTSYVAELQGQLSPAALDQAVEVIRKRLDPTGTRELMLQPIGSNRISVQIPGLAEADKAEARTKLSKVAKLEFRLVHPQSDTLVQQWEESGRQLPIEAAITHEVLPNTFENQKGEQVKGWIVVDRTAAMSGKHVSRAFKTFDQIGRAEVALEFDGEGRRLFGDLTEKAVGQRLAIVLDGEVRSAPRVNERIDGNAVINGMGNATEADELSSVLENPLETPVQIIEERGIDPSLGRDSIESGRNAGVIAFVGVIIFMVIYYRFAGLVAVLALVVNLILMMGLLAQFHFTLTLPGIAGIVLTIGIAVDANVLIYERIRDELAHGKPLRQAIHAGFDRAFSAIFDSNITTLIPAVVLMFLGTGPLRGFAVTLTLGIIANLFAAVVVTRNVFEWLLAHNRISKLTMMHMLRNPKFDFLRYGKPAVALSMVLILASIFVFSQKKSELLGVDFTGGDALTLRYEQLVPVEQVRSALEQAGVRECLIQYARDAKQLVLQARVGEGELVERTLRERFPQAGFAHGSLDSIGPQVGDELKHRALFALGLGLLGILVYAAIRFEWAQAVAAAIGQLHDVLIAIGMMALLQRELTLPLVGAFLTIAGYSINDKIVVFDRIREGMKLGEGGTLREQINRSLNLTLARTLLTGTTMIIATLALIFFGGPVIHDFALAMLIGILSGLYSSHFISPPLAEWLDYSHQKRKRAKAVRASA